MTRALGGRGAESAGAHRANDARRLARCALGPCLAAVLCAIAVPHAALAQTDPSEAKIDPSLLVLTQPIFGGTSLDAGGDEVFVEIRNTGEKPRKGTVELSRDVYGSPPIAARSSFAVGPGETVTSHLPVASETSVRVVVRDEAGVVRSRTSLTSGTTSTLRVIDVEDIPRLSSTMGGISLDPDFRQQNGYSSYTSAPLYLQLSNVRSDRTTGDPILPHFAQGWRNAHLTIMKSETLTRIGGVELEALETHLLGGGTLAVVVTRPEDLAHPTLEALLGGHVERGRAGPLLLSPVAPTQAPTVAPRWTALPNAPLDTTQVMGFAGGNAVPSPYGATATYGLGEVVLLGFDPTTADGASDPWVQVRVADLAEHAYDHGAITAFGPASPVSRAYTYGYEDALREVRRLLDPNQNARWAIGVATALLCLYALLAGPIAFMRARRKQKPLRALWALPAWSAATFALVVGVGVVSKGSSARSRRLTVVDAGAGMSVGTCHRFRGFFSGSASELTVVAEHRSSTLSSAPVDYDYDSDTNGTLRIDADGARLEGVAAIPWQTVLVRERGLSSLGGGISVTPSASGSSDVIVRNRTGRTLRGVVVATPSGSIRYVGELDDGKSVDTRDTRAASPMVTWSSTMRGAMKAGRADVHPLAAGYMNDVMHGDEADLPALWMAAQSTVPGSVDWFPSGVPVVLASVEGGERRVSDAGMPVDADHVLVRVVGWGGEP